MFKKRYLPIILIIIFVVIFISPKTTYAYLDPGSNSYLFQIAVALLMGIIFSLKVFYKRIVNKIAGFIKGLFKNAKNNSEQ